MGDTVSYQLEIEKSLWHKFKKYKNKVFWDNDGIKNIDDVIIYLIKKFIGENET